MNKTTEALKLAEALENDAKEHREVSYGLDCLPERTANWKHALNCEAAARLIREALAEPVKQEPVGEVDLHKELGQLRWMGGDEGWDNAINAVMKRLEELYAAPVDAKAIRAEERQRCIEAIRKAHDKELCDAYDCIKVIKELE